MKHVSWNFLIIWGCTERDANNRNACIQSKETNYLHFLQVCNNCSLWKLFEPYSCSNPGLLGGIFQFSSQSPNLRLFQQRIQSSVQENFKELLPGNIFYEIDQPRPTGPIPFLGDIKIVHLLETAETGTTWTCRLQQRQQRYSHEQSSCGQTASLSSSSAGPYVQCECFWRGNSRYSRRGGYIKR